MLVFASTGWVVGGRSEGLTPSSVFAWDVAAATFAAAGSAFAVDRLGVTLIRTVPEFRAVAQTSLVLLFGWKGSAGLGCEATTGSGSLGAGLGASGCGCGFSVTAGEGASDPTG